MRKSSQQVGVFSPPSSGRLLPIVVGGNLEDGGGGAASLGSAGFSKVVRKISTLLRLEFVLSKVISAPHGAGHFRNGLIA